MNNKDKNIIVEKMMYNMPSDPNESMKAILQLIGVVNDGDVNIVDPTNPFMSLLSASILTSTSLISEQQNALSKIYPSMARSESDLHHHFCYRDNVDIYAKPSRVGVEYYFNLDKLYNGAVVDGNNRYIIIPENTNLNIDKVIYSMMYAIKITFVGGPNEILINYLGSDTHPLQKLETNIIDSHIRKVEGTNYVMFKVSLLQVNCVEYDSGITKSLKFQNEIRLKDQFCYLRAFVSNDDGTDFTEINVSLSDTTYDPNIPSIRAHIDGDTLTYEIPGIYKENKHFANTLKLLIYTTKGKTLTHPSNNEKTQPRVNFTGLSTNNNNMHGNILSNSDFNARSVKSHAVGRDKLTFSELKERVINNNYGETNIPISELKLKDFGFDRGFKIYKNTDTATHRTYLAIKDLPDPLNKELITPINLDMSLLTFKKNDVVDNEQVIYKDGFIVIKPGSYFLYRNDIVKLLDNKDLLSLRNFTLAEKVDYLNKNKILTNIYTYVMELDGINYNVRAYDLDRHSIGSISYDGMAYINNLNVQTGALNLERNEGKYKITIETKSGSIYKKIPHNDIGVCFRILDIYGKIFYVKGKIINKDITKERVFELELDTKMEFHNRGVNIYPNDSDVSKTMNIVQDIEILYFTKKKPTGYSKPENVADIPTEVYGQKLSVLGSEKANFTLGTELKYLWKGSKALIINDSFMSYENDVYANYEKDTFDTVDGEKFRIVNDTIVYNKLHKKGEPIIKNGKKVILHPKGSIMKDVDGNNIPSPINNPSFSTELLMVNAEYKLANRDFYNNYLNEIRNILTDWITTELKEINNVTLEQTDVYYHPLKNHGVIRGYAGGELIHMVAHRKIEVTISIQNNLENISIRDRLARIITKTISDSIKKNTISLGDINTKLREELTNNVESIVISNVLDKDHDSLLIQDDRFGLSLDKRIKLLSNDTTEVSEDIKIIFKNNPNFK